MRRFVLMWTRILFGGSLLLGTTGAGCLADVLRDVSDELDEYADEIDDEDNSDFDDFIDDLEDLFD